MPCLLWIHYSFCSSLFFVVVVFSLFLPSLHPDSRSSRRNSHLSSVKLLVGDASLFLPSNPIRWNSISERRFSFPSSRCRVWVGLLSPPSTAVCREAGLLVQLHERHRLRSFLNLAEEAKEQEASPGRTHSPRPQLPKPAWRKREMPPLAEDRVYLEKVEEPIVKRDKTKELFVFGGACAVMWFVYRAVTPKSGV